MTAVRLHPLARTVRGGALAGAAFSLIELLIALAVLGVVAGAVIPLFQAQVADTLEAAAQIVAADLDYGRNLAVTNQSRYRFTFQRSANLYYLEHTGASAALEALPASPFAAPTDRPDVQTTDLDALPLGGAVALHAVYRSGSSSQQTTLEFQPLGNTTATQATVIWLTSGAGTGQRYLPIRVDPVTGLIEIGELTAVAPTATSAAGSSGS